jgi:Amt family ammonium transporter
MVAGLVVITPCAGHVLPWASILIGGIGGGVCYFACRIKNIFGYDDALDAFGVHGVGGALGAMLTGVFASSAINPAGKGWLFDGNPGQLLIQFYDVAGTFIYCGIVTFIILKLIDAAIGLRVERNVEIEGLDINLHGEVVP